MSMIPFGYIVSYLIKNIEKHFRGFSYFISLIEENDDYFAEITIAPSSMCLDLEFRTYVINYLDLSEEEKEQLPSSYFYLKTSLNYIVQNKDAIEEIINQACVLFSTLRDSEIFQKILKEKFKWTYLTSHPLKHTEYQLDQIHRNFDELQYKIENAISKFNSSKSQVTPEVYFESITIQQSSSYVSTMINLSVSNITDDVGYIGVGCDVAEGRLSEPRTESSVDEILEQAIYQFDFLYNHPHLMRPPPSLKTV